MNFLAHTLLGFADEELITGQVCGDFVRGSQLSHFPVRLEAGIRLHRHLDAFTDSWPDLQAHKATMQGVPQRFAGIVIDVLFDHFLALNWTRYSSLTLAEHAERVDHALALHRHRLPKNLQHFMVVLSRERMLENNMRLSAIEFTLERLSRRSPRFAPLAIGQVQLQVLRTLLQGTFESFYPELLNVARTYVVTYPDPHVNSILGEPMER